MRLARTVLAFALCAVVCLAIDDYDKWRARNSIVDSQRHSQPPSIKDTRLAQPHLRGSEVSLIQAVKHVSLAQDATISSAGSRQTPSPDGVTETTSESWLERMQDAMASFCVGIILIIFSVPVMWVNERRSARMESLLARGDSEVRTAKSSMLCVANEGTLVHVSDGSTKATMPVSITAFRGAELQSGCVRLRTTASVYQWVEKSKSKTEKNNVGGGTTKTTTYTYEKEWVTTHHDSSKFKEQGHDNKIPAGLQLGVQMADCSKVEYGDVFIVPHGLVQQMSNFVNAGSLLGNELVAGTSTFSKGADGYFECPVRNGSAPDSREGGIGDARVKVEYVAEGSATIMALQAPYEEDNKRHSFLPYRLYSRGLCGMREDEEKSIALKEGQKDPQEIADDDMWTCGPLSCLCCACNLVSKCFGFFTPEIYHIFDGALTEKQCVKRITAQNMCLTWGLRIAGWLMMFIGLYLLFQPLLTFVDIIPFLGPLVSTFGGYLIFIACFLVTLTVASLIMCVAYLAYRPLVALMYGAVVAACVSVPLYVIPAVNAASL